MAKTKTVEAVAALFGRESIEAYLSPAQCDAVENFAVLVLDHSLERDAFTEQARAIVGEVGQMPFATWKPVIKAIKTEAGDYAAKCYRDAYKALYGALPNAGTGSGNGSKGMSPKRFASGLETRVAEVVEYIAKASKGLDVNASTLARVAKAADSLMEVTASLKRAVNE